MKKVMMLAVAASLMIGTAMASPAVRHERTTPTTTKTHVVKKEKKEKPAKKAGQKKAASAKSADKHS